MKEKIKEFIKIEKKEDLPIYIGFPFLTGMLIFIFGLFVYEILIRNELIDIIDWIILGIGVFIGIWVLGLVGIFLLGLIVLRD